MKSFTCNLHCLKLWLLKYQNHCKECERCLTSQCDLELTAIKMNVLQKIKLNDENADLSEVGGVPEHVYVEQLGNIATPIRVVLLAKCVADLCAFSLDDGSLLGRSACRSDFTDQIAQSLRCRHFSQSPTTRPGQWWLPVTTSTILVKQRHTKLMTIV